jgi:hypothetical protein
MDVRVFSFPNVTFDLRHMSFFYINNYHFYVECIYLGYRDLTTSLRKTFPNQDLLKCRVLERNLKIR